MTLSKKKKKKKIKQFTVNSRMVKPTPICKCLLWTAADLRTSWVI